MTEPMAETTAALTAPGTPFEMEERDIRGVRIRVWKNAPPSLRAVLERSREYVDRTFLVYEDERTSFSEHFARAATFAHRLIDRYGVTKGDRVAIAMRNFPEWPVAFFGAAAAGAIVVPLNAWWTGPELAYGLSDSGAKVVVADEQRLERVAPHLGDLPGLEAVIGVRLEEGRPGGVDELPEVLGDVAGDVELPEVALDPEDDATIFYTSGTTGRPKGALGTHRNICTNLISLAFGGARGLARSGGAGAGAMPTPGAAQVTYMISVPFFHATGCHSILLGNTYGGGKLVIMHRWDPERALELIERERVNTFGGVPSMVWQVLDSPNFATRDTSSVTSIGYGGAPAPPELVRRIEALLPGRTPTNGYGLTETSSITSMNVGDDYRARPESVGAAVAVCDVKVVDDGEGNPLPTGSVGELWIRGPNIVKGYWDKPAETAAAISDGWLHSGDLARLDDEGFIYIVDRAKDIVIRGGENVYCVEVETALFEHPAVRDAAVIGIPDAALGEQVGAVVHAAAGADLTEGSLIEFLAGRLAGYKVPVRIWFRDEPLPRNATGKILKRALRDELVGSTSG